MIFVLNFLSSVERVARTDAETRLPMPYSKVKFLQRFGQMTPWCKRELWEMTFKVLGGNSSKRLPGVGVIWQKGT